ncbi:putative protein-like [Forsythia ovata]|uniref:Uncharacterized protein n=1 Tax=Forsythia ovata TaxID=205694 RepID=A0ABD1QDD2_9LAMI
MAAGNFVVMTDLRNKISTFRDLFDLAPCVGSASVNELLICTVKDLQKFIPCVETNVSVSEFEGVSVHQALIFICDALKSIGDLRTNNDEWMINCKYNAANKRSLADLEQLALAMLEDMIKLARERLYDTMDGDEGMRDYSLQVDAFGKALSESYSDNVVSFSSFPETPTSVLPEIREVSNMGVKASYSPPLLFPLRVQAVRKLNPIDLKRVSFHILPHAAGLDSRYLIRLSKKNKEEQADVEAKRHSGVNAVGRDEVVEDSEMTEDMTKTDEVVGDAPGTSEKEHSAPGPPAPPPLPPLLPVSLRNKAMSQTSPPPPPPPPLASRNTISFPPPPPPPLPFTSGNPACPPPPPPPMTSRNAAPLPPAMGTSEGTLPPPPPPLPLMSMVNGTTPPPPPGLAGTNSLRPKKATTKLKRSSHMGNLYRLLKGKIEGSSSDGKSSWRKGKIGSSTGGKQGMADALAEMTKRSAYFQQIEEDVKNHSKSIKEVKAAITSFQTSDMAELIKFHKYVESHLEKLTDETQVLARFEDFPTKKLESLRMAAVLYSKLDSVANTLQNWQVVSPIGQLLDKVENYFNKIKGEMDALERTKDEDSKKFRSHKINFDFSILVRIKELMVDVSSSCMELALKEIRDLKAKEKEEFKTQGRKRGSAKMLWKAFQFAFRVYTFAGGQDDRADKLTRELAHEIETNPY